ncbi:hypothetical protein Hbl1158_16985 (plasmid) [Halobaculum sp. CBA1158]|uniref:hypothetical protein n=1 Tax=Halobaculum sp. CBA1158 TaxID=2904243 RepID=UPI001F293B98|nr:hypothetical protein [Halobaculum sp. CBA1158]UIP01698.1 hypothetical protein Hbl1158_16985 [Halobaculum sp. CBA1158]
MKIEFGRRTVLAIAVGVVLLSGASVFAATGVYTSGSTFQTDSGLSVTLGSQTDLSGNPFDDSQTLSVPGGTVEHTGSTDDTIRVDSWDTGSGVALSNVSADSTVQIEPSSYDTVGVRGDADSVTWGTINTETSGEDISTSGVSGSVDVTFYGLESNEFYQFVDGSGDPVDAAESDNSGEVTLSVTESGSYDLQLVDNELPEITNTEPQGDVVSGTVTLAADIDDDQLPDRDVNLTWRVDGTVVHEETISSAGRYNYTLASSEVPEAGQYSWSVTAEDPFEAESTEGGSFGIPGNLTVRNVSNTSESVDEFTATIYTESGSITRSTTNGSVSLSGVPGGDPVIIDIQADGYRERTTVLPTVLQQQTAYVLGENTTAVETRFSLEDPSGEFPPETELYIERAVDVNGTEQFQVVAGDRFGVEGVTVRLEEGQRYRLRIVAPDGDTAVLGKYVADLADEVPLRPQSPAVTIGSGESFAYNASASEDTVSIGYNDPANQTDVLTVSIVNRFNDSDYLLEPVTYYGTNSLSQSVSINESLSDGYLVVFEGQRNGQPFRATVALGPEQIDLVPGGLDTVWIQIVGSGLVLVTGGLFSRLNIGVGVVSTSLFSGILWYIGLLEGVATSATIAVAILFSVVYAMVRQ